jgi:hypothetical protein
MRRALTVTMLTFAAVLLARCAGSVPGHTRHADPSALLKAFAGDINHAAGRSVRGQGEPTPAWCTLKRFGSAWGEHALCERPPRTPCVFHSYGISNDYSFDTQVANDWGCSGVAVDPSVDHPSHIHPRVTFHNFAARTLDAAGDAVWQHVVTMPGLRRFLGHRQLSALKIDCEGCEYAIAEDVLREDPHFFRHVDQVAIEIHLSRKWAATNAHADNLGRLYDLVTAAGLRVAHATVTGCAPEYEALGCHPAFVAAGFACDPGEMCQNVLLARGG